jgi:uncharacterized membrane protein YoaK (UPF0700 family)
MTLALAVFLQPQYPGTADSVDLSICWLPFVVGVLVGFLLALAVRHLRFVKPQ